MDNDILFRLLFFVLFFAVLFVRGYYGLKMRRAGESSWALDKDGLEREGMVSILARLALFVYMLAAAVLYAWNPGWLAWMAIPLSAWARWSGVALGLAGLALLVWVHATLGRQWSTNLRLRDAHKLVTDGPYRWVRHPMYTALFAFFIGLGVLSANWLVIPLVAISIPVLAARIGKEEQMMVEQFGEQYITYMQHTGRFLPRLMPGVTSQAS